ncbi:MAG: hypothetical protein ACI9C2_002765, partial [Gammaproteobacteria bacterium]
MEVQSSRRLNAATIPSEPRFASHLAEFEARFGDSGSA